MIAATKLIEQSNVLLRLSFSALDVLAFPGVQQESELDKTELSSSDKQAGRNDGEPNFPKPAKEKAGSSRHLIEERCVKIQGYLISRQLVSECRKCLPSLRKKLTDRIMQLLVVQPDFDRLEQELVYLDPKA